MPFVFSQLNYRQFKKSRTALNSIEVYAKAQLGVIYSLSCANLQLVHNRITLCSTEMQPLLVCNIATFSMLKIMSLTI